jgi:catechol 2,3-dioxygenase-like lactoylglutathione lyase family enzyme
MNKVIERLFREFDEGRLSRRELLRALGVSLLAVPSIGLAQGGGGRAGRDSTGGGRGGGRGTRAPADTTHATAPFEPTGWKTVWFDHITYQATDYTKAVPFYAAVMGWKVRSEEDQRIVMEIGPDVGDAIFINGFVPPPPLPTPPTPPAGDSAGGGRGGGRGNRPPRNARISNLAFGIEPWDTAKVESELQKRGLNPVAEHSGDFKSFHIKDPDGFDIQVTNGTKANRHAKPSNGKLPGAMPFEPTGFKTLWVDHLSYGCTDFKKTFAFYEALLGWKQAGAFSGVQVIVDMGDAGGAIIRNRARVDIDHISFGIEGFDPDKVEAELMKRGLGLPSRDTPGHLQPDTGSGGDIHTSRFKSYHTPDPFGWDLQISNITRANRHDT